MKKLLAVVSLAAAFACSLVAQVPALGFGAVATKEKAYPVIASIVWQDDGLTFAGGVPSLDALAGYNVDAEKPVIGYQVVLNWKLTPKTWVYAGGVYLDEVGQVRFDELLNKVGLTVGVRTAF